MSFPKDLHGILLWFDKVLHYQLFEIKSTPITLSSVVMFAVVMAAFYVGSRIINRGVLKRLLTRFHMDRGTRFTLLRINHYTIMIIGTLVGFQFVGIDLSGLAVIFGLLSVGIGFGLQNVTSNFISGLILLFERPISVGDRVTVGDTEGDVLSINMRSTTILSLDNISIIVPNSQFVSSNVVNWSHGDPKIRASIDVGVSYDSNLDLVLKALQEIAKEHPKVLDYPKPDVLFLGFGDSTWNLSLRVWIKDPKQHYTVRSELNIAIVRKFRQYEIEIAFPQRDLHFRSPLPIPLQVINGEAVQSSAS